MAKKRQKIELPKTRSRKVGLSVAAACKEITDALSGAYPGWQVTVTELSEMKPIPDYAAKRMRIEGRVTIILKYQKSG